MTDPLALTGALSSVSLRRRYAAAFISGCVLSLTQAPFFFWGLSFVVLPFMLVLCGCFKGMWRVFFCGWLFGLGYFLVGLYWVGHALVVYSPDLWWLAPFASFALAACLALFYALVLWVASFAEGAWLRVFVFVAMWGASSWARGHALTGFPWNLLGYGWGNSLPLLQAASWAGVYGMTVLLVFSASSVLLCVSRRGGWGCVIGLVLPLLLFVSGEMRLSPPREERGVGLRLVQANIPQREKWNPRVYFRHLKRYRRLSQEHRPGWVRAVVWPESALPYFFANNVRARRFVQAIIPQGGYLMTGSLRRGREGALFNSVVVLGDEGEVVAHYDKVHLVPFGEYMPFGRVFHWKKLTHGLIDFTPGAGHKTLSLGSFPSFSPTVCYEAIFPGEVTGTPRPHWLLNVTNDGWYGTGSEPYQHFVQASFRAVEEGVPLVRVAGTGISGVVDAYGRVVASLPVAHEGILDVRLPSFLPPTFYGTHQDMIFFIFLLGVLAGCVISLTMPFWCAQWRCFLLVRCFYVGRRQDGARSILSP